MTHADLAAAYLRSARRRLPTLDLLLASEGYNDVVRGAQDIVELAGKAMLRAIGSDPPHVPDVGERLLTHLERFAPEVRADLPRLAQVSRQLRRHPELAYYGAVDFIPDQQYTRQEAEQAIADAVFAVGVAERAARL